MTWNGILLTAFFVGFAALAQIPPQSDPSATNPTQPIQPLQPGRDPSGPGAIIPGDTQPMPPDYDTRNPQQPRVRPTPNNRIPENKTEPGHNPTTGM